MTCLVHFRLLVPAGRTLGISECDTLEAAADTARTHARVLADSMHSPVWAQVFSGSHGVMGLRIAPSAAHRGSKPGYGSLA